jgi:hypothetical protein
MVSSIVADVTACDQTRTQAWINVDRNGSEWIGTHRHTSAHGTQHTAHSSQLTAHRTPDTAHRTPDTAHRTQLTGHSSPDRRRAPPPRTDVSNIYLLVKIYLLILPIFYSLFIVVVYSTHVHHHGNRQ